MRSCQELFGHFVLTAEVWSAAFFFCFFFGKLPPDDAHGSSLCPFFFFSPLLLRLHLCLSAFFAVFYTPPLPPFPIFFPPLILLTRPFAVAGPHFGRRSVEVTLLVGEGGWGGAPLYF